MYFHFHSYVPHVILCSYPYQTAFFCQAFLSGHILLINYLSNQIIFTFCLTITCCWELFFPKDKVSFFQKFIFFKIHHLLLCCSSLTCSTNLSGLSLQNQDYVFSYPTVVQRVNPAWCYSSLLSSSSVLLTMPVFSESLVSSWSEACVEPLIHVDVIK